MKTYNYVIVIVLLSLGMTAGIFAINLSKAGFDLAIESFDLEALDRFHKGATDTELDYDSFYKADYYYDRNPSYKKAEQIAREHGATLDLNIMGNSGILTIPEWMSQGTDTACEAAGRAVYEILSVLPEDFLIHILPEKGGGFVPSRRNPVDLAWAKELAGIGDPDQDQYPDSLKRKMNINY